MDEIKFHWNETKSLRLKRMRGLSFEELTSEPIVDVIDHPSRNNQVMFLFKVNNYIWAAPAVLETEGYFLKTFYPSRKHNKFYCEGRLDEKKD